MSPGNLRGLFTWLPLIILGGTGLIAWGQTSQRVEVLEEKAQRAVDDHDRIVRIETQMTSMTTTMSEIRGEQKELGEDVQNLEKTLQSSFNVLLQELRNPRDG
jgi:hypothetical protein